MDTQLQPGVNVAPATLPYSHGAIRQRRHVTGAKTGQQITESGVNEQRR
jgi:hypothetical protein